MYSPTTTNGRCVCGIHIHYRLVAVSAWVCFALQRSCKFHDSRRSYIVEDGTEMINTLAIFKMLLD